MTLARLQKFVEKHWYSQPGPLWVLYPLECVYRFVSGLIRKRELIRARTLPVPVLVVGNINVGGTGKTPALISLVNFLRARGLRPGVVTRGYGREAEQPVLVHAASLSREVGEEPLLVFQESGCPVSVHSDRYFAALYLLKLHPECNVILADDGLQHYKLKRDFELALIDGERLFGNRHLLPVGPLRESPARLATVDWIVVNQRNAAQAEIEQALNAMPAHAYVRNAFYAQLITKAVVHIRDNSRLDLEVFTTLLGEKKLAVLAAVGNPQAFFTQIKQWIPAIETHSFPDHHFWSPAELQVYSGCAMLCTSKDAMKIKEVVRAYPELNADHWYYLEVELDLDESLTQDIYTRIVERQS